MQKIQVSASILSADMCNLEAVVRTLETSGTDMLHFDVMDGRFVDNISFGIPVLEAIRKKTDLFLDVHLMISDPLHYAARFAKAGANGITFHLESESDPQKTIDAIHACGIPAGIVIKPNTPAEAVLPYLSSVEMVLVMTVEPGFGGQSFMHDQLPKIAAVRKMLDEAKLPCELEVDGGIDMNTAALAKAAGANVLVAGSSVFGKSDRAAAIKAIREA